MPKDLAELPLGMTGVLACLDLPPDVADRLMALGFVPGATLIPVRQAPGGDPRIFRVDGGEVALRRETARRLLLQESA